jgi:hypothetical protein
MEEKVDFKPSVAIHEHRLRQLLICDNYRATVIIYCADCRQQVNQYYEYLNNEQMPHWCKGQHTDFLNL